VLLRRLAERTHVSNLVTAQAIARVEIPPVTMYMKLVLTYFEKVVAIGFIFELGS